MLAANHEVCASAILDGYLLCPVMGMGADRSAMVCIKITHSCGDHYCDNVSKGTMMKLSTVYIHVL